MRYENVISGRFVDRPNRFIAHVETAEGIQVCHVKNTGRCRELLVPGATVYLEPGRTPGRRTAFDLIAVEKGSLLINMDAQAPNRVFEEWATAGGFSLDVIAVRREVRWGDSRLDFCLEMPRGPHLVEVKGVTLEEDGVVRFPDAPTLRGVKHLEELVRARQAGYEAAVCFVVQMEGVLRFEPNDRTHPAFGQALRAAAAAGVEVLALDCRVTPDRLELNRPVPVAL